METNTVTSLFERFNQWLAESVMIKLFSIGFLMLILLIPASWIEELINERQGRADSVMKEVADKWSGTQTLAGPILVIPFTKEEIVKRWQDGKQLEEKVTSVHRAYFLPEHLQIGAQVNPEVLHRGIFDVAVYQSKVQMEARFSEPDFSAWNIPDSKVHWKEAAMIYGLSDLRGISENPAFSSGSISFDAEPSSDIGVIINTMAGNKNNSPANSVTGLVVALNWQGRQDFKGDFNGSLSIRGSEGLYFVPAGKTTVVKAAGQWF
jgi:inner membrane protein